MQYGVALSEMEDSTYLYETYDRFANEHCMDKPGRRKANKNKRRKRGAKSSSKAGVAAPLKPLCIAKGKHISVRVGGGAKKTKLTTAVDVDDKAAVRETTLLSDGILKTLCQFDPITVPHRLPPLNPNARRAALAAPLPHRRRRRAGARRRGGQALLPGTSIILL